MESNRLSRKQETPTQARASNINHSQFLKRVRRLGRSWLKRTSASVRVVSDNFQLRQPLG
jgi:hypothetical protein